MRQTVPVLVLALSVLLPSSSCKAQLRAVRSEEVIGRITLVRDEPMAKALVEIPLNAVPAHVDDLYRLAPDRRLLIAIGEVHRLLAAKPKCEVSYRFLDGKWAIRVGSTEAGSLPEIPTYSDARRFLSAWATRELQEAGRAKKAAVSEAQLQNLATTLGSAPPEEVLKALEELNRLWKKGARDPRLIREGARGLIWLSAQTYDGLGLSDPLLGKAWALLAVARTLASPPDESALAADEALLAETLGYQAGARKAAEPLGADDPVRLYVNHSTAKLKEVAEASKDRRPKLLFLLRLAGSAKPAEWYPWISSSSLAKERSLGTLRAALALDDFGPKVEQLAEMRALVVSAVLPPKDAGRSLPVEGQLGGVEAAISAKARDADGAVLNAESVRAFFGAALYSAIHGSLQYYFDQLGTTEGAEAYLKTLVAPPPGPAAELAKWGTDRVAVRRDRRQTKPVIDDISSFRSLRGEPVARLRNSLNFILSEQDAGRRAPMPAFFATLDSRPAGLFEAYRACEENLFDSSRAEALLRVATAEAPFLAGDLVAVPAYRDGDRVRLWEIARGKDGSPLARGWALRSLYKLDRSLFPTVRDEYERLMCEETESGLAESWVDVLTSEKELPAALAAVRRWTACRAEKNDLSRAWAAGAEAGLLRETGKPQEAWTVIEPWVQSWKGDVMREAALALADLGRLEQAIEVSRAAQERYESGDVDVAGLLWRAGRPDEAADVLKEHERRMTLAEWARAGTLFGKAYAKRTPEAIQAFDLVKARKIAAPGQYAPFLSYLAAGLGEAGDHETCFQLHSRVDVGIASDIEYARLSAYEELQKARGDEVAGKWLKENVPTISNQMAVILLQLRRYDLLLNATATLTTPAKNDVIQLFRAAALRHLKRVNGPEMKELIAYFEGRPYEESFVRFGLYLTGARDETVLPEKAEDLDALCSIGWIRGVRAASEGRFQESRLWLQTALESRSDGLPPYAYAQDILRRWWKADKPLSALQAEGTF